MSPKYGGHADAWPGECIDWTQRCGHLNGALAAAITDRLFEVGWIARGARRRSVLVTAAGAQGLADTFGSLTEASLATPR